MEYRQVKPDGETVIGAWLLEVNAAHMRAFNRLELDDWGAQCNSSMAKHGYRCGSLRIFERPSRVRFSLTHNHQRTTVGERRTNDAKANDATKR